jgi:hypothetical protein
LKDIEKGGDFLSKSSEIEKRIKAWASLQGSGQNAVIWSGCWI